MIYRSSWSVDLRWMIEHRCYIQPLRIDDLVSEIMLSTYLSRTFDPFEYILRTLSLTFVLQSHNRKVVLALMFSLWLPSVFWFTYICILKILSRSIHQAPNIFFLEFNLCEKVFYWKQCRYWQVDNYDGESEGQANCEKRTTCVVSSDNLLDRISQSGRYTGNSFFL